MTRTEQNEVILGTLAIDYLTLVSPEITKIMQLFRVITYGIDMPYTGDPYDSRYPHAQCGPFRIQSIPRQKPDNGRILSIAGTMAHHKALHLAEAIPPGHLSRIDLQVTVPLDEPVDLERMFYILSNPDKFPWKQTGKTPYVQLIRNTDGGETIYIGKRTSDLMTRIYRKTIEGVECLRWELEIKGRLARGLQEQNVLGDPNARATFARAVLAGYPEAVQRELELFARRVDEPTGELVRHRAEADDDATMLWFRRTVVPALKRAMRGKLREQVVELLRENDWHLTNCEEWDKMERRREAEKRQTERKFKKLYERTTTR